MTRFLTAPVLCLAAVATLSRAAPVLAQTSDTGLSATSYTAGAWAEFRQSADWPDKTMVVLDTPCGGPRLVQKARQIPDRGVGPLTPCPG
jgi:hypothetical protein